MLLRDLLVALPGLIGSTGTASRVQELEVQDASQIVVPTAVTSTKAIALPDITASSGFLGQAMSDYYKQTGFQPPATPEPEPPVVPTPDPDPTPLPSRTENLTAEAGRVLTIEPTDSGIASIKILSQTSHGHVSVNPDKTLSLVLSEDPDNQSDTAFSYEITYQNGKTQQVQAKVDVVAGQESDGWGKGDFYMLETGADGRAVVEHGENHRKVYVTEGAHGLTAAEIAKAEGIAVSKVTGKWLLEHPEYGATPDKALDTKIGMELWYASTGRSVGPNSNWLLFERGYDYGDVNQVVARGASGESALNPMYIGAYGQGDDPLIRGTIKIFQSPVSHVVIQNIDTTNVNALLGENLLFDNISVTLDGMSVENVKNFSLVDSDIIDVARLKPLNGGKVWDAGANKIAGVYVANSDGVFLDGNFFDHNGWADGYNPSMSISGAMPPSKFNHNLYVQNDNLDVTVRDNIFMRGSSFGAQIRPGGVIENNAFIDNNAGLNFFDGKNYTLALGNIVTSAGYRQLSILDGALSMGIDNVGKQSSLIGNIVAHLADPNNKAEQAIKKIVHTALASTDGFVNDTIVYNWTSGGKAGTVLNTAGLSKTVLDQTTIQNFTADLLGKKTATISDLANYLRAQADGKLDKVVDADVINAFFRKGFGLDTTLRDTAEVVRFTPDDRADGFRWDNRLNWSTEDLPGTQDGDSVDLGGNRVLFGAETVTVDDFIFGNFGQLKATSGKLEITGDISTGKTGNLLQIDNAGQVWIDGYRDTDLLSVELAGGRLANTGTFAGKTAIEATQDAQLLLATSGARFDLAAGSSLKITGGKAKVGFDGGDGKTATLQLHDDATLSFVANATGLGKISEFYSGAFDTSKVTSGIRLDGDLKIDLAGLNTQKGGTWTLIDADQIIGSFDDIAVTGLAKNQDALIRVDYVRDEVVLVVGDAGKGSGQIRSGSSGDADFIDYTQDAVLKTLWSNLQAAMPQVTDDPI
ncbi:right-handed parallel beta-helix repeat-containing protein [Paracoccus sp. 22332]|uniref:right-handed parallel beta-helix repeat-containing protein n=1 Tax=Paracoccus sp. 22332 TaxID=3453913 RepID=UPI003F86AB9C